MANDVCLLDTPKKLSLRRQADTLRAALKDFERSYSADHNGCKPSKIDIKENAGIAGKYKQYQRVQEVLAGKLAVAVLEDSSPKRRKSHERSDSTIASSSKRRRLNRTPTTRRTRLDDVDPYDPPSSATPKPLPTVIGPTPQRNGKLLGIFDLLSNPSTRRSHETPRQGKQKLDVLDEFDEQPGKENALVAQTPSQRPSKDTGDLLDHLAGTPIMTRLGHSRTPISDGKKFMLSQFFATPSAVRYASLMHPPGTTPKKPQVSATPLRDRVLGPAQPQTSPVQEPDATPAYLKRSHSFKDRLLSASQSSAPHSRNTSLDQGISPVAARTGPRIMKKSRFMPKPLSQIAAEMRKQEDERYDDDEDALREMEEEEMGVLVDNSEDTDQGEDKEPTTEVIQKVWKKKGQKRSTRRAIIRPSNIKTKDKPDAALDISAEDDADEEPSRVEETQLPDRPLREEMSDDELLALMGSDFEDTPEQDDTEPPMKKFVTKKTKSIPKTKKKTSSKSTVPIQDRVLGDSPKSKAKPKSKSKYKTNTRESKDEWEEVVGKINPNAASHTNFRSLKIRNKNSKGKGRFGRR